MTTGRISLFTLPSQVIAFASYVARSFRLFHWVLGLTVLVLVLEYVATSLMLPLAPGQSNSNSVVTQAWIGIARELGLKASSRTWLWLFFLLMTIRLVLGYLLSVLTTWLGKRVHETLSGKVFGHVLLHEPMGRVYTRSIGHYITMAGDDTFKSGTIISSLLQALVGLFTALVGLFILFLFSVPMFLGVMAFLGLAMAAAGFWMRRVVRLNAWATSLSRELGTTFVEALNSLRSIRSLHSERFVMATYAAQIHAYVRMLLAIDAIKAGVKSFPAIFLLLLAVLILRPGAELSISDAGLFAGTVIIIRVFASLGQLVTAGSQLLTDIRVVHEISNLIALAQARPPESTTRSPAPVRNLTLVDVSFAYGDRGTVLDRVSFRFEAGKAYAVVGPSGAGKSTLADILLGLTTPDSGTVLVNEGRVTLDAARRRFTLVEQQSKIFSTTLRENLLLGTQLPDAQLFTALELVSLDEMVRGLDKGLDTRLTYLGENFSGGQRQRLGIARALLRNPEVLILDEATSALDGPTRAQVVAKLRHHLRDGIIIFITHDTEIAELADEVLMIGPKVAA